MYKTILMPTDGSPCSFQALEHGLGLAKLWGPRSTSSTFWKTPPRPSGSLRKASPTAWSSWRT